MKQTSGMYTETEWIKSDSANHGSAPADEKSVEAVKMNDSEWQERIEKLTAEFDSRKIAGQAPRLPNRGLAAGAAALQQTDAHTGTVRPDASAQIKTGVLSPLREDEGHYYAVAVTNKGKDQLKLATVAWLKEPLRSWLAKAETQVPVTMAAVSANYTLPVISGQSDNSISSVACTDDTWTASITSAPAGRLYHTAVWTGSEMIIWGGSPDAGQSFLNTGGRYNPTTDSWTATSTTGAPAGRAFHTAV